MKDERNGATKGRYGANGGKACAKGASKKNGEGDKKRLHRPESKPIAN
jgi:hypothetical protein